MPTERTAISNRARKYYDLGATDDQGRRIGMYVDTFETTYVDVPDSPFGFDTPAGDYFVFITQPARDNERVSKSHEHQPLLTAEQRDAAIAEVVEAARKRAA